MQRVRAWGKVRAGTCSDRIVRCTKPFGHTSLITFLAVLTPPPVQGFCSYLADFFRLQEGEEARVWLLNAKSVRCWSNKSLGLDSLPHEVYLRLPYMFVPILTDMFNHWFAQRAIPGSVIKGVITLLKKGVRYVWEDLDDYGPITLLYIELDILAKVLADRLQLVISHLIMLCFDLFWPGQKCHSRWCTGRKWHILVAVMRGNRVGGNWLMKWDEVKKKSHYTLIDWRTGREWPLNCMTVISARWRSHRLFQR